MNEVSPELESFFHLLVREDGSWRSVKPSIVKHFCLTDEGQAIMKTIHHIRPYCGSKDSRSREKVLKHFSSGRRVVDIAAELGVSRTRVDQVLQSALRIWTVAIYEEHPFFTSRRFEARVNHLKVHLVSVQNTVEYLESLNGDPSRLVELKLKRVLNEIKILNSKLDRCTMF